ncbi:hypothetical protein L1987_06080 [Smallanthus sonchifolius]|uniref:Uncharacterized protein n=1 Tax=Smallanthus sonchifolius TaxID=185202 RepID=A0ACB9JX63_9ASTR|nr:hypothetical protein L1987_06080 [Smallanthus sonchifolius]
MLKFEEAAGRTKLSGKKLVRTSLRYEKPYKDVKKIERRHKSASMREILWLGFDIHIGNQKHTIFTITADHTVN